MSTENPPLPTATTVTTAEAAVESKTSNIVTTSAGITAPAVTSSLSSPVSNEISNTMHPPVSTNSTPSFVKSPVPSSESKTMIPTTQSISSNVNVPDKSQVTPDVSAVPLSKPEPNDLKANDSTAKSESGTVKSKASEIDLKKTEKDNVSKQIVTSEGAKNTLAKN